MASQLCRKLPKSTLSQILWIIQTSSSLAFQWWPAPISTAVMTQHKACHYIVPTLEILCLLQTQRKSEFPKSNNISHEGQHGNIAVIEPRDPECSGMTHFVGVGPASASARRDPLRVRNPVSDALFIPPRPERKKLRDPQEDRTSTCTCPTGRWSVD